MFGQGAGGRAVVDVDRGEGDPVAVADAGDGDGRIDAGEDVEQRVAGMEGIEDPPVGESAGGEAGDAPAGFGGVGDQDDELVAGVADGLVRVEQDRADVRVGDDGIRLAVHHERHGLRALAHQRPRGVVGGVVHLPDRVGDALGRLGRHVRVAVEVAGDGSV